MEQIIGFLIGCAIGAVVGKLYCVVARARRWWPFGLWPFGGWRR